MLTAVTALMSAAVVVAYVVSKKLGCRKGEALLEQTNAALVLACSCGNVVLTTRYLGMPGLLLAPVPVCHVYHNRWVPVGVCEPGTLSDRIRAHTNTAEYSNTAAAERAQPTLMASVISLSISRPSFSPPLHKACSSSALPHSASNGRSPDTTKPKLNGRLRLFAFSLPQFLSLARGLQHRAASAL